MPASAAGLSPRGCAEVFAKSLPDLTRLERSQMVAGRGATRFYPGNSRPGQTPRLAPTPGLRPGRSFLRSAGVFGPGGGGGGHGGAVPLPTDRGDSFRGSKPQRVANTQDGNCPREEERRRDVKPSGARRCRAPTTRTHAGRTRRSAPTWTVGRGETRPLLRELGLEETDHVGEFDAAADLGRQILDER